MLRNLTWKPPVKAELLCTSSASTLCNENWYTILQANWLFNDGRSSLVKSYRRVVIKRCAIISVILIETMQVGWGLSSTGVFKSGRAREFFFLIKKRTSRLDFSPTLYIECCQLITVWCIVYVNWRITYSLIHPPPRLPRKLYNILEMFISFEYNVRCVMILMNDKKYWEFIIIQINFNSIK